MIKNQLKTVLLLGLLTGLLLGVGQLIGGAKGLTIGLILAVVMNFGSFWFSDKIVLMMYRARKVTEKEAPALYKIVREVSKEAGIPMPVVYIVPTDTPNAFATGRSPKHSAIACTKGILSLLSDEELKGVIAHEMSHVRNRDTLIQTIAATIAGVISYAAYMARFAAISGRGDNRDSGQMFQLIALSIITPLLAMIIQLAISRSREFFADESGARIIKNPEALASALEKLDAGVKKNPLRFGSPATSSLFIVNPFSAGAVVNLLSTHPPLKVRIQRLRSMKI